MSNKLHKIKCAILDDDKKLLNKINIDLAHAGGDELKDELDGVEFQLCNTQEENWLQEDIGNYSVDNKIDFWIVDSRVFENEDNTDYSFRLITYLKNLDQNHCVFTSDPSFEKRGKYECKVFKKDPSIDPAKAKDAEPGFHGGLLEMVRYIKDQVGWGEFAPYVKFLDYTSSNYHGQLKTTMREISKSLPKVEDSIDSPNFEKKSFSHLVKHTRTFIEVLFVEFKELGFIPDLERLYSSDKSAIIANCIQFLTDPNSLNTFDKIQQCKHLRVFKFKEGESKIHGSFYEIENHNGLYKLIDKSTGPEFAKLKIGKNMQSTLIGASLQFIYAFDNTNLHYSGFEDKSHSVRSFLEAFKFVCLRLNILFPAIDELLPSDNNAENSVNEEVADESNSEEVIKETPTNEGTTEEAPTHEETFEEVVEESKAEVTTEVANEEAILDEDVNQNVEDEKEDKTPTYRQKTLKIKILGKKDLDENK